MMKPKAVLVALASALGIAAILLAILGTVSAATTTVILGVAVLVISAAILQK